MKPRNPYGALPRKHGAGVHKTIKAPSRAKQKQLERKANDC